ncbi:hypothetical protein GA0115233_1004153 [Streptomyces sp. DI166]|uniref:hypothetical protein n=1 Tax=Streptomyces sp. DI166 TaxID=1839783 RepID=UPI0007F34490|nr:hypothetical protein [Streptomyces sp. DI166]SBT88814.1 hypothetical protein GA0115233_1004153 [Streptomyces sp. DI166]
MTRPDPVTELADRLDDFVAAAVHPDEIAALLESDGLTDDLIRERYGADSSFALAEHLYTRVPRRHPEPRPAADPWRVGLLPCLLRGIVFALPGFGYVLAAPLLGPSATLPLLTAALFGWAWNQGVSHRAYTWLGLGDKRAARDTLLRGGATGAVLGTVTAAPFASTPLLFAAAAQSCYLAAATALLVLGRERALLTALLPLTAGATVTLVHPIPVAARVGVLTLSLTSVVTLALLDVLSRGQACRRAARVGAAAPRERGQARPTPTAPPLAGSLPYALFALASGALVVHTALDDVRTAAALTLSMGPAEYLLYRFRSATRTTLRSATTPRAFRRRTTHHIALTLTTYLATLLALTSTLTLATPDPTLLILGTVIWTGLLLQSFGAVTGPALVCTAAALAQPFADTATVHVLAAIAQLTLVRIHLGRATAHR